jgi:hypothetical protein
LSADAVPPCSKKLVALILARLKRLSPTVGHSDQRTFCVYVLDFAQFDGESDIPDSNCFLKGKRWVVESVCLIIDYDTLDYKRFKNY